MIIMVQEAVVDEVENELSANSSGYFLFLNLHE